MIAAKKKKILNKVIMVENAWIIFTFNIDFQMISILKYVVIKTDWHTKYSRISYMICAKMSKYKNFITYEAMLGYQSPA